MTLCLASAFADAVGAFRDGVGGEDAAPGYAGVDERAASQDGAGIDDGVAADFASAAEERAKLAQAGAQHRVTDAKGDEVAVELEVGDDYARREMHFRAEDRIADIIEMG